MKNEIEFDHEAHLLDGIILPQLAEILEQFQLLDLVDGHTDGQDVEGKHVAGVVELAVFGLGEMETFVELVQDVFLHDGMSDDPAQRVEDHSAQILPTERVVDGVHLAVNLVRHVVLCGDEHLCKGLRRLEHEPQHDDHAGTRNNVPMVLNYELLAEDWRALPLFVWSGTHRHRESSLQLVSCTKEMDLNKNVQLTY